MAKTDEILFTVLDNGDVKIETDKISAANHASADKLLDEITAALGGKKAVTKKGRIGHGHTHGHVMQEGLE